MAGAEPTGSFESGLRAWQRTVGTVRDVVRQELVGRQLDEHLPRGEMLHVLDAGCGQGTQVLRLARLGHRVLGIDISRELLDDARDAVAAEPPDVQARVRFEHADLYAPAPGYAASFDVVCCHGVLMYQPSLTDAIAALVAVTRPDGLISVLTRNQASLAMRAGMSGDWHAALKSFDEQRYTNRLGVDDVRADDPADVRRKLAEAGAHAVGWYGVRLFCDHWPEIDPPPDVERLIDAEEQAGRRDPYRALGSLTHTIARVHAGADHGM